MSESAIEPKVAIQYLLGALPEAETERLDELSITDDRFAESLKMAEHDLVDAYVLGELSEADLQRFKSSYLNGSDQRLRVRLAQALQEWTPKDVASESVKESKRRDGMWLWPFGSPQVALRWGGFAAALILLVVGGWLWIQNLRAPSRSSQTPESQNQAARQSSANVDSAPEIAQQQSSPPVNAPMNATATPSPAGRVLSFVLAPPTRDASPIRTLSLPPDTRLVKIRLEIEADLPLYRAQLLDAAGSQTLWRSAALKPQTSGQRKVIELSLPASLLKSEIYVLRVSGGSEVVGDYSFRIAR